MKHEPHIGSIHISQEVPVVASRFGIGQQVRHTPLGYLGVIVNVDPGYSFAGPREGEITASDELCMASWHHAMMEDDNGQPICTYLVEVQLSSETHDEHPEQPPLDELAKTIRQQLQTPCLRN